MTHVPADVRDAVALLWAFDERMGRIVATTTQPMIGLIRLTWWREAVTHLNTETISREPMIARLAATLVEGHAIAPSQIAAIAEGWEPMLDPLPLDDEALETHARLRGDTIFAISGQVLGHKIGTDGPGGGWALADFAARCSDAPTAARAWAMARKGLAAVGSLPRPLRVLARLARGDAAHGKHRKRTLLRLLAAAR